MNLFFKRWVGMALLPLSAWGMQQGVYVDSEQPGISVELARNHYKVTGNINGEAVTVQEGSYRIDGKRVLFAPVRSDIGYLEPSQGIVVDDCTLEWTGNGHFHAAHCTPVPSKPHEHPSHFKDFPKTWVRYEGKSFILSIPKGCKVREEGGALTLEYGSAKGRIVPIKNRDAFLSAEAKRCGATETVRSRDGASVVMTCKSWWHTYFEQIVFKETRSGSIAAVVSGKKPGDFKALSIALASLKPKPAGATAQGSLPAPLPTRGWHPSDQSFAIEIPRGWRADGGTADLGANGYVRIVQAASPADDASFVGVYYPFYQYVQTPYGSNGAAPMQADVYVKERFLAELRSQYRIAYPNVAWKRVEIDEPLSRRLSQMANEMAAQYGLTVRTRYTAVQASGTYTCGSKPCDIAVYGVLQYTTMPLQGGMAQSESWGPAPLYVVTAPKGGLFRYFRTFERMATSFRVDDKWLRQHLKNAAAQGRQIVAHYRKMSQLIHENSERRILDALAEHDAQENEIMEEHWDTFFALGGEERYEDPETGEEIDVPTGADRYFYDRYSQAWTGIRDDDPDAGEIVEHLKEDGYEQLRLHTH